MNKECCSKISQTLDVHWRDICHAIKVKNYFVYNVFILFPNQDNLFITDRPRVVCVLWLCFSLLLDSGVSIISVFTFCMCTLY